MPRRWLDAWHVASTSSVACCATGSLAWPQGTYDAIAAVTATVDGSARRDAQVHVLVNPKVTGDCVAGVPRS